MSQSTDHSHLELQNFVKIVSSLLLKLQPTIFQYILGERFIFPTCDNSRDFPVNYDTSPDLFPAMLSEFVSLVGQNPIFDDNLATFLTDCELDLQMFLYPQSKKFVQFILSRNIIIRKLKIVGTHLAFFERDRS
ncbi:unnamed protein product [Ambrosiozyma monospora]|uniref:Unnamed protein product n=1 Tax=Ambrosiozyma monospora TaxID=43982 RepID=A0ACB5SSU4_AMBMO|nr:unnamed protein product [Ambrosiozyma monospora]